jgi:hypothetical protein
VAVDVHRDSDAGMAESFLRDLGVDTGRQQMRGVAVAQVVQPN